MSEDRARDAVTKYVASRYPDYPTDAMVAQRFEVGWTFYAAPDPTGPSTLMIGQRIFLVGDNGEIMESSSSLPPGQPEAEFIEQHGR